MADDRLEWVHQRLMWSLTPRQIQLNVCVFGSGVMLLHGLREEIGDVDLFVTEPAYLRLSKLDSWAQCTPHPADPPFLEWTGGRVPVHCFVDWAAREDFVSVADAWARSGYHAGWRCMPLWMVREWKLEAHRRSPHDPRHAKHLADAAVIGLALGYDSPEVRGAAVGGLRPELGGAM